MQNRQGRREVFLRIVNSHSNCGLPSVALLPLLWIVRHKAMPIKSFVRVSLCLGIVNG